MSMDKKDFIKKLKEIDYTKRTWELWSDFITIVAITLSNAHMTKTDYMNQEPWRSRENQYLEIIGKYSNESQNKMGALFAHLVGILEENPYQDFLGEVYMDLELNDNRKGQFFTPYHVSKLMAEVSSDNSIKEQIEKDGYISICDTCCGSGVMLIAFAESCREKGINYQQDVLFVAQDIDKLTAKMCFIQLSLLGCSGYVIVGNSLTTSVRGSNLCPKIDDIRNIWFTPMFVLMDCWHRRRVVELAKGCIMPDNAKESSPDADEINIEPVTEPRTTTILPTKIDHKPQGQRRKVQPKQGKSSIKKLDNDIQNGLKKLGKFFTHKLHTLL